MQAGSLFGAVYSAEHIIYLISLTIYILQRENGGLVIF
jgi:hypothetical protein